MINLDKMKKAKDSAVMKMSAALKADNTEDLQNAFDEYGEIIREAIMEEVEGTTASIDRQILATRGCRVLTSEETKYYNSFIEAAKAEDSGRAKMQISGIMETLPITFFESVLEDIETNHPLLQKISFVNTTGISKFFVSDEAEQSAQWGPLTEEFKKQLSGAVKVLDVTLCKLTAYFLIAKDMLDLGPAWIDRYIREIMVEALATGLETGIVAGTGKDMPIGMIKNVADDVTVTGGVYPDKSKVKLTKITPKDFANICVSLTKTSKGKARALNNLVLIVNPTDYLTKIMPATTYQNLATGGYIGNILPLPCDIIQSAAVPDNCAIIGLSDKYFMGMGMSKSGKIELDDSVKFLEDERAYTIKTYGNGRATDNNAFVYVDISELEPSTITINTITSAAESESST